MKHNYDSIRIFQAYVLGAIGFVTWIYGMIESSIGTGIVSLVCMYVIKGEKE